MKMLKPIALSAALVAVLYLLVPESLQPLAGLCFALVAFAYALDALWDLRRAQAQVLRSLVVLDEIERGRPVHRHVR